MEQLNKHIEGPWRFTYNSKFGQYTIRQSKWVDWGESNEVATVLTGLDDAEDKANAHLIAAAPELLSSLEDLLKHYIDIVECGDCGNWDAETEKEVVFARAAINKARGIMRGDGRDIVRI